MVGKGHRPAAIPQTPSLPQTHVQFSADGRSVTGSLPTGESVTVLLTGATVISWKTKGQENLFLSDKAVLDGSKAVRGGIPVVFPVFGPPPSDGPTSKLPQHGFARSSKWEFLGKTSEHSGSLQLDFGLSSKNLSEETRKAWPYDFNLTYNVAFTKDTLETILLVRNTGKEAFEFNVLFHTYLDVKDISTVSIHGLKSLSYKDKTKGGAEATEAEDAIKITGETDRVYSSVPGPVVIAEGGQPRFEVTRDSLDDVVVWNPWEGASKMADFGPADGFKKMLCIEPGAVAKWQKLEAGDMYEGCQIIKALL